MKAEDWIKTSDRLPENSDLVVVCIVNMFGFLPPLFDFARYIDNQWRCNDLKGFKPTHWMPIVRPKDV